MWSAGFLWPPQSESLRLVRMLLAMVPGNISPSVGLGLSSRLCCKFQVTDGGA